MLLTSIYLYLTLIVGGQLSSLATVSIGSTVSMLPTNLYFCSRAKQLLLVGRRVNGRYERVAKVPLLSNATF